MADRKTKSLEFLGAGTIDDKSYVYTTPGVNVSKFTELLLYVDVDSVTGSGKLALKLQSSPDNINFFNHTTFSIITAAGQTCGKDETLANDITNLGKYIRLGYYIPAGTSVTLGTNGIQAVVKT